MRFFNATGIWHQIIKQNNSEFPAGILKCRIFSHIDFFLNGGLHVAR